MRDTIKKMAIFEAIWIANFFLVSVAFFYSMLLPAIPIMAGIIAYQAAKIIGESNIKQSMLSLLIWLPFPGLVLIAIIGFHATGEAAILQFYNLAVLAGAAVGFIVRMFYLSSQIGSSNA